MIGQVKPLSGTRFFLLFVPVAFALLLGGFAAQDEARISALMGGWPCATALVVLGVLVAITLWCSHRLSIGLRTNLNAAVSVATSSRLELRVVTGAALRGSGASSDPRR